MSLMNKRGEEYISSAFIYIIISIVIVAAMYIVLVITTGSYINSFLAHDEDLLVHIYAYRAVNICIAHQDEITKRYYPGVLEYSKYNQENLDSCYFNSTKSFFLQLRDLTKSEPYDRIIIGFGNYLKTKTYPVMIKYNDGTVNQGELLFGSS